jgi:ABC-type nitrate/sulfonate/bicarbonate transport systems, periplasmic components
MPFERDVRCHQADGNSDAKDDRTHDEVHRSDLTPWPQPPSDIEGECRNGRAARRGTGEFSRWRLRARRGPEVTAAKLGFIALTDASPLFVAKEKGIFAKYGMPDVEVQKQASWGTTRDNLVLGSEGNGIDGAHILTPMPYLISSGKVTQNNQPTPMYILARLNLNGSAFRSPRNTATSRSARHRAVQGALDKKKAPARRSRPR